MTNDRRRAPRVPRKTTVRYRVVGSHVVEAMRDVSRSGAFIECAEPLPLGSRVEISLDGASHAALRVEGVVVRVVWGGRDGGRRTSPGMAIAFDALDDETLARVEALVAEASSSSERIS